MRLPPEQYCLTGVGWDLKEEFDEEMDENDETGEGNVGVKDEEMDENEGGDEKEGGRLEDIFGNDNDGEMEE